METSTYNTEKKSQDIKYLTAYVEMVCKEHRPQDLKELIRKYEKQSGAIVDLIVIFQTNEFLVMDGKKTILKMVNKDGKLTRVI
jgi:hypothetical protein